MDLGTNTFHLLIVALAGGKSSILCHRQEAVKLGEGGINKGCIAEHAFARGIQAMRSFRSAIDQFAANEVRAIGTSALRNAENGKEFLREVDRQAGITIEVIDGDQEAMFIYHGVKAGGCLSNKTSLIIDIGGGSVEFILCNQQEIFWKQSFEIGAARLIERFHRVDPIPPATRNELGAFLLENMNELAQILNNYHVDNLIGSSGAFETFAEIIEQTKGMDFDLNSLKRYDFVQDELAPLLEKLASSNRHERQATKGIILIRVEMIVVAAILTLLVLKMTTVSEVILSTNSLKEGVLAEMTINGST